MIHLQLQPEIKAQLAAEAAACGLPLDRYIESIVTGHSREAAAMDSLYSPGQKLDEQQLAANLREGLADICRRPHPPRRGSLRGVAPAIWHTGLSYTG